MIVREIEGGWKDKGWRTKEGIGWGDWNEKAAKCARSLLRPKMMIVGWIESRSGWCICDLSVRRKWIVWEHRRSSKWKKKTALPQTLDINSWYSFITKTQSQHAHLQTRLRRLAHKRENCLFSEDLPVLLPLISFRFLVFIWSFSKI